MTSSILTGLLTALQKELSSSNFLARFRKSDKDFTRQRYLTIQVVTVFTLQHITKSLSIELFSFWQSLTGSFDEFVTKQAWSLARKKLKYEAFIYLNQLFCQQFYQETAVKTWRGRRLLVIDGSTVELPNQKDLVDYFGKTSNQKKHPGQPTARTLLLYDPLNDLILESKIGSYHASEKQLTADLLDAIKPSDLVGAAGYAPVFIYDKGFPSTGLMLLHQSRNESFVMACKKDYCVEIEAFIQSAQAETLIRYDLAPANRPGRKSHKKANVAAFGVSELVFRAIRVEIQQGQETTCVLITNLLDAEELPAEEIAKIYAQRWGIEEGIKSTKLAAQIENFSGKTPEVVMQDFFARMLIYNIASLAKQEVESRPNMVQKIAEADKKDLVCQVNQAIAIGLVKKLLPLFLLGKMSEEEFRKILTNKLQKSLLYDAKNRNFERIKSARKHPLNRRPVT